MKRFNLSNNTDTKKFSFPNAAKAGCRKLCNCSFSEPGKINLDIYAHQANCWIRKKLQTKRYTVDTSVTPEKFTDGYALGVAFTQ
jgi:hypothetical protein